MIQWESQYELGIKSIDDQHKKLIEITGHLSELLTNATNGEDIYDEMVAIIESLTQYTISHFQFEEALFHRYDYPSKEAHIEEHNKLISEISALDLRAIDEDQVAYGKKILKFLITWVFKHISGSDFLYRDLMIKNGVQ